MGALLGFGYFFFPYCSIWTLGSGCSKVYSTCLGICVNHMYHGEDMVNRAARSSFAAEGNSLLQEGKTEAVLLLANTSVILNVLEWFKKLGCSCNVSKYYYTQLCFNMFYIIWQGQYRYMRFSYFCYHWILN